MRAIWHPGLIVPCFAQEADLKGTRTLGVLAKVDKADRGVRELLDNKGDVKLGLGFVAVRNRNTADDAERFKSAAEWLAAEVRC